MQATCASNPCTTNECCVDDVVVVKQITTTGGAENSIATLNNNVGASGSGVLNEQELQKQYDQRKEILKYLNGNTTTSVNKKTELLEKVTTSTTTLDVGGAELAMDVSYGIMNGIMNTNTTTEKRQNITQKVGGIVSNVVLALDHFSQSGAKGGFTNDAYTRAVRSVDNTISRLSDAQLVGIQVNGDAVALRTFSFELVSQRVTNVGTQKSSRRVLNVGNVLFNSSTSTTIAIPPYLGANVPIVDTCDLQLTLWNVNLHEHEEPTVAGFPFAITLKGIATNGFTESLRDGFIDNIKNTVIQETQHSSATVTIVRVSNIAVHDNNNDDNNDDNNDNNNNNRLRRLLRNHLRRRYFRSLVAAQDAAAANIGLVVDFVVTVPKNNSMVKIKNHLNQYLQTGMLGQNLSEHHTVTTSSTCSESYAVSTTVRGSTLGFDMKQNGEKLNIEKAGWFIITKNWTAEEKQERERQKKEEIGNQELAKSHQDQPIITRVIACNSTNVGTRWNVQCGQERPQQQEQQSPPPPPPPPPPPVPVETKYTTTNLTNGSMTATNGECSSSYITSTIVMILFSICATCLGITMYIVWNVQSFCNNTNEAINQRIHHYDDWLSLYIWGGASTLLSMSFALQLCTSQTATVVQIHIGLVCAAIVANSLTIVTIALLLFLVPKSYAGCFPSTLKNKQKLYQPQLRQSHFNKQYKQTRRHKRVSTYELEATPRHKKEKSTIVDQYDLNVDKIIHEVVTHKRRNSEFKPKSAGPVEIYTRFHRNWPLLVLLLCALFLPCSITTMNALAKDGISLSGSNKEKSTERPFQPPKNHTDPSPPIKVVMERVQDAKTFNNNMLVCLKNDDYSITLECPLLVREPEEEQMKVFDDECLYWDTSLRIWSSQGCELVSSTPATTTCRCNHLTDFGVAMKNSESLFLVWFVVVTCQLYQQLSDCFLEFFLEHRYTSLVASVSYP